MLRLTAVSVFLSALVLGGPSSQAQQSPRGRALAIEDYYRVQNVGNPTISSDARWVTYTVSTRVEEDNSTETQSWVVGTDGASKPARVLHYGRDISGARWTEAGRLEYVAERQTWSADPANLTTPPQLVPHRVAALVLPIEPHPEGSGSGQARPHLEARRRPHDHWRLHRRCRHR